MSINIEPIDLLSITWVYRAATVVTASPCSLFMLLSSEFQSACSMDQVLYWALHVAMCSYLLT